MRNPGRSAFAALAFVWMAAWSGGIPCALAGDPKVAEVLLKNGKQALSKGDEASAENFFRKAMQEDPDLIEACWWRGSALEKSGDPAGALSAYREYLGLVADKAALGIASKEELRLRGLAEKSVDVLAAGEKEFRKLDDACVAAFLQFAKDNFVRDPSITAKALAVVETLRPGNEDAAKIRSKLGGAAPAAADAGKAAAAGEPFGPFRDVKKWRDLLMQKTFEKDVSYANGMMTHTASSGSLMTPGEFVDMGENYAYEHEFHLTNVLDRTWLMGLVVAWQNGKCITAFVQQSSVVLCEASNAGAKDLVSLPIPEVDAKTWHRFGVIVRGAELEVWLDGKRHITWTEPSGRAITGELGIYQQACSTERRVLRAGKLE